MKNRFKVMLATACSAAILALAVPEKTEAQSIGFSGGVKNEYYYEEYIFLTGTPIKFKGTGKTVTVTTKESKGKLTDTYKLKLTGPNGESLTRNYTYTYDVTNYDQIGQSSATGGVTKFTEKITIGETTYTLVDYQLSDSTITDTRPASSYYAGNANARKTYSVESDDNDDDNPDLITVHIDSRDEGYENFWGATESQTTEYEIEFADGTIGTVQNKVATSKTRTLEYNENEAALSSFNGNYKTISAADTVSEYTYDLPATNNESISGKVAIDLEYMPKIEMLKIPKFRDLSSNWARENIEKLYSLGILDDQSNFYSPNTPVERYDFAIAIGKAIDLRVLDEDKKKTTTKIFDDVKRTVKDHNYLEAAVNKGVIKGTTPETFEPDGFLTRQQAAAILVRALGLEGKAPDPNYATQYKDDYKITDYARDSVYVVTELGLMSGSEGNFNPKGTLTRAQSAAIIDRFLQYLESDLKENYRSIIDF